jgi:hypothetical protein
MAKLYARKISRQATIFRCAVIFVKVLLDTFLSAMSSGDRAEFIALRRQLVKVPA